MRRFLSTRHLILVGLLLVFEYALSPFPAYLKGRVDLLYLLVLDYAFFWSWERVPFFALMIGLLRDFSGAHLFGIQTAALTATSLLLYLGTNRLERENALIRFGICFLFVALTEALSLGLAGWLEIPEEWSWGLMGSIFWTTIYTAAVAPGFFWLTDRWFQRVPTALRQYELF